jgi:hypothetical protein
VAALPDVVVRPVELVVLVVPVRVPVAVPVLIVLGGRRRARVIVGRLRLDGRCGLRRRIRCELARRGLGRVS